MDPGSGIKAASTWSFTLKLTVNFKDVFQFKKFHGQRIFANKRSAAGSVPDTRSPKTGYTKIDDVDGGKGKAH
jgi:hypothetical protein